MRSLVIRLCLLGTVLCKDILPESIHEYEGKDDTIQPKLPTPGYQVKESYYPDVEEHRRFEGYSSPIRMAPYDYIDAPIGGSIIRDANFAKIFVPVPTRYYPTGPMGLQEAGLGIMNDNFMGKLIDMSKFGKSDKKESGIWNGRENVEKEQLENLRRLQTDHELEKKLNIGKNSGYYKNFNDDRHIHENNRKYQQGQQFEGQGQTAKKADAKQGHTKGHKIGGFKNSHHKDESGTDEAYYDEVDGSDKNNVFKKYVDDSTQSYKARGEKGNVIQLGVRKKAILSNDHSRYESTVDQAKYVDKKSNKIQNLIGFSKEIQDQSILGHQESNKYFKSQPFMVPFHHRK